MLRQMRVLLVPLVLIAVQTPSRALDDCDDCDEFLYPTHDTPAGSRVKCHADAPSASQI